MMIKATDHCKIVRVVAVISEWLLEGKVSKQLCNCRLGSADTRGAISEVFPG